MVGLLNRIKMADNLCDSADVEEHSLQREYHKSVRPMMDLIDELRELGVDKDVDLPQIVVIGHQSSGKSSTLEALSGIQLPRGQDLMTKTPLTMSLRKNKDPDDLNEKFVLRYTPPGKPEVEKNHYNEDSMDELEADIKMAQEEICGDEVFRDEPIKLLVERPYIPDLSLIDLPGIAVSAITKTKQTIKVEEKTLSMARKYITQENALILVVVPANVDVHTQKSLELAKEVDPNMERTLGVVTKADDLSKGEHVKVSKLVQNQSYPLKKGFTLIRCRTPHEVEEKIPQEQARQKEKECLSKPEYHDIPKHLLGVENLAKKLSKELEVHIKRKLPDLRHDVRIQREQTEEKLKQLGEDFPQNEEGKSKFLNHKCQEFLRDISNLCLGENPVPNADGDLLNIRVDLRKCFKEFSNNVEKLQQIGNCKSGGNGITIEKVQQMIETERGRETLGFVKFTIFEKNVKDLLKKCREPALRMLTDAEELVDQAIKQIVNKHFQAFPEICQTIKDTLQETRDTASEDTKEMINRHFEMEDLVYIDDDIHRDLLAAENLGQPRTKTASHSTREDATYMVKTIDTYFKHACKRMREMIPMSILLNLTNKFCDRTINEVNILSANPAMCRSLKEDPDTANERARLKTKLDRLREAKKRLDKYK